MPRLLLALLATVVALAAPACTVSKSPHPSTPSTATTTSAPPEAHAVYEQCLTQHGVPSPPAGPPPGPGLEPQGPLPGPPDGAPGATPPPPPPGVDQATWANAQQACASLQPTPPTASP